MVVPHKWKKVGKCTKDREIRKTRKLTFQILMCDRPKGNIKSSYTLYYPDDVQ